MHFSRVLLVAGSFIATAFAQNSTLIAFTTLPGSVVTAGQPVPLAWSGGDGVSPVTITLKQGPSGQLATVSIITGDATGNSYTWTPSTSLPDAPDYSLQISQGVDDVNYSGQFQLVGGATATSTTMTSTASASASTAIIITGGNTTITGIVVATTTLAGEGSLSGTGTALNRNTTFSSQTISGTATTGGLSAGPSATTTGTGTATATASTSATPTGAASNIGGSSLALVLCAVVGMFVLN